MSQWRLIAGILLIMLPCQILVWSGLKMIFGDKLTSGEYYSLSIAGWILPILFASVLWLLWIFFQRREAGAAIVFILLAIPAIILFFHTRKESLKDSKTILFILLVLFGLFIFLRLAFVSKVTIPLYFDSAHHYLIIKKLVGNPISNTTALFPWLTSTYYHIGFHFITAFIVSVFRADILNTMLLLGQIILAVIPLSVFFLVKHETQSGPAGIFAVLLAAFGWYMPAHAVDWGKYPALTSLLSIAFVLSLAYLSVQHRSALSPGKYLSLHGILFFALSVSVFIHSRSLVIFGIVALAGGWHNSLAKTSKADAMDLFGHSPAWHCDRNLLCPGKSCARSIVRSLCQQRWIGHRDYPVFNHLCPMGLSEADICIHPCNLPLAWQSFHSCAGNTGLYRLNFA
jgi:hypothetical protein